LAAPFELYIPAELCLAQKPCALQDCRKKKTRAEGKQDNQSITRSTMHAHQVTDQISLFLLFLDVLHQARGFCPSELRCQRKATPKMPEHFVCGQAFQSKELLNQLWRNYIHTGEVN